MTETSSNPQVLLAEDVAKFYSDPLGFVRCVFPWGKPGLLEHHDGPDRWQKDFLIRLGQEVKLRKFDGHRPVAPSRMCVVSGHGVGKSVLWSWLVLWIMATRPRCRGVVTASTFQQLSTRTWAALQQWTKMSILAPWFTVTGDRMWFRDSKDSWFVSAQSCGEQNSESFAGQHANDSSAFYIFDEASAVPDQIFQVAEGGLTDGEPMIFLFGNPTRGSGQFHRAAFGSERERWIRFSVDSRQSRFSNKETIAAWIAQWGEDHDWVRVRIRGEAPRAAANQLIGSDIVAFCRKYQAVSYEHMPKIFGVDVARQGDDRSVIVCRQGRLVRELGVYRGLDTVQLAERVIEFIQAESPQAVVVDGTGMGAGTVDALKHRGFGSKLFEFLAGGKPDDCNAHFNKRRKPGRTCAIVSRRAARFPIPPTGKQT